MDSKYKDLFKNKSSLDYKQSERRQRLLEEQKQKRNDQFLENRGILELVNEENLEQACQSKRRGKRSNLYKNKVQLSEFMIEPLENPEDWLMVPVAKGRRCLVVKFKKRTLAFYKNGGFLKELQTNLPRNTILDCFYNDQSKTFYVIDLLLYNGKDYTLCEYQFRHFWIKNKILEEDFRFADYLNDYKIEMLECFDMENLENIQTCLEKFPMFENNEPELDGLLFYHKESDYIQGRTPLVLWLFPFMMPELFPQLNFNLDPMYLKEKPADYTNYLDFIKDFEAKNAKQRRKKDSSTMDISLEEDLEEEELQDEEFIEHTSEILSCPQIEFLE